MDPVTDVLVAFVVSESNNLELVKETLHMMDSHPCADFQFLSLIQSLNPPLFIFLKLSALFL